MRFSEKLNVETIMPSLLSIIQVRYTFYKFNKIFIYLFTKFYDCLVHFSEVKLAFNCASNKLCCNM